MKTMHQNMGLDVGVYFGDKKELGKTHTICTWQSLNSIKKQFLMTAKLTLDYRTLLKMLYV